MRAYEVYMVRKRSISAYQNSRRRVARVRARDEAEARREASRMHPEFFPESARRVP